MAMTTASPLELQEYLFADTNATAAVQHFRNANNGAADSGLLRDRTREVLRLHRFTVISWLMTNGVKIPVELLDDSAHPEVGNQYPDKSPV